MSINLLKKLVSSVAQPEIAKPAQRKPPQRVRSVNTLPEQAPKLSVSNSPTYLPKNEADKMLIPASWNEVIGNPQVWAEIRPVIVDED